MLLKKNLTLAIMSLLLVAATTEAFAQSALKIAYIRPKYIFSKYQPYLDAEKKLDTFQQTEMAKLEKEKKTFDTDVQDFQKRQALMSEEQRATKQDALIKQQQALQAAYDELTSMGGTLDKKQDELIAPIIDEVNKLLMTIGEKQNYDLILDAEAGGLLYANDKYDISDAVLEELNKGVTAK